MVGSWSESTPVQTPYISSFALPTTCPVGRESPSSAPKAGLLKNKSPLQVRHLIDTQSVSKHFLIENRQLCGPGHIWILPPPPTPPSLISPAVSPGPQLLAGVSQALILTTWPSPAWCLCWCLGLCGGERAQESEPTRRAQKGVGGNCLAEILSFLSFC